MSAEGFEDKLDKVYEQYRHRELDQRLEEIAEVMEETILQSILADRLFGLDIEIHDERKQTIQDINDHLQKNNLEIVEERLDELDEQVEEEHHRINVEIQDVRSDMADKVSAMKRLNDRIDSVEDAELNELAELFESWDWKPLLYGVDSGTDDIEDLKTRAEEYGLETREAYDNAKKNLFGRYEGTELEDIVEGLLDDERFSLDTITEEQMNSLRDSDLEEHVELSLS